MLLFIYRRSLVLLWLLFAINALSAQRIFTNPLKPSGPDPWVIYKNGWFFYMNTIVTATGENELKLWRTRNMAKLATAESKTIFDPPDTMIYSKQLWAPEIHFLNGKWYVYFAADDGINLHHRIWVLENSTADPFEGQWLLKGKLTDPGDHWAIDLTVHNFNGRLYATWSGWEHYNNVQQNIYIAELENPWTMKGDRVLISTPKYEWERHGQVPLEWQKATGEPSVLYINEGPQFLQNGDNLFIIYSASACWLDYKLGMLQLKRNRNVLNAKSWKKHRRPVFVQAPENGVYAPGHNSFFKSPDGKEDWILYHANPAPDAGCGASRAPHMQQFTWTKKKTPLFGKPVPVKTPLPVPSGTEE
jgi:GH43 family beta-xylosidase